ncbi:EscU/YscU/HrcU family type III secretion system export apparatus switch protein [Alkalicoccobacillus plakortidis]|uniref:EscU/YscU/HrcU family type III secretion system export apparatus switch protein n=1 Tax=Alkalicoccobacillus plakortidis TaxID=444060 RepID=A0ABT0XFV7_9BACI|nr:EscU/YscU/HrcU family type III secretion system export apparatus switch protein [Alkalicoccobacillus plakortidis]MCM2674754.1 EscU/YscU/HrcU family type III secretion system export apparatus switch protein [Alkalicoccobacillus plakortidis]
MKKESLKAVALKYLSDQNVAPIVVAKGEGFTANEIIKTAKESQIPIQEDESLVELLSQLTIHESIPPELYEVVAELFSFIYRIDRNQEPSSEED